MSEGASQVRGCEIFASGNHRGKTYTPADIDCMVENFNRYSTGPDASVRVPIVIGHDESQEFLEKSDLPAAGWGARAYAENGRDPTGKPRRVMKLDFSDVAPDVVRLLKGRAYRDVSAEVYDDSEQAGLPPGQGKVLRRVAMLGGDRPQVKGLKDIPTPEAHSERFAAGPPLLLKFSEARPTSRGTWICFAEAAPMGPQDVLKLLAEHGCDTEALHGAQPQVLNEFLRVLEGKDEKQRVEQEESAKEKPPMPMAPEQMQKPNPMAPPEGMEGQPPVKDEDQYDDQPPEPKDDEERMNFAAHCRRMAEGYRSFYEHYSGGKKFDEEPDEDEQGRMDKFASLPEPQNKAMFAKVSRADGTRTGKTGHYLGMKGKWGGQYDEGGGGRQPSKVTTTQHFSESQVRDLQRIISSVIDGKADSSIARLNKCVEEQEQAAVVKTANAVCSRFSEQGKLSPAEVDDFRAALLDANTKDVVAKFSEKGKTVSLTQFDRLVRMIDRRPSRFTERFKMPAAGTTSGDDPEVEKLKSLAFEKFSEAGFTQEKIDDLVEGFKSARKYQKGVTAEQFLGA